ncbi:hypothetical protein D3C75_982100 [compost metagenome]
MQNFDVADGINRQLPCILFGNRWDTGIAAMGFDGDTVITGTDVIIGNQDILRLARIDRVGVLGRIRGKAGACPGIVRGTRCRRGCPFRAIIAWNRIGQ